MQSMRQRSQGEMASSSKTYRLLCAIQPQLQVEKQESCTAQLPFNALPQYSQPSKPGRKR
jgi:hypothetical protein